MKFYKITVTNCENWIPFQLLHTRIIEAQKFEFSFSIYYHKYLSDTASLAEG